MIEIRDRPLNAWLSKLRDFAIDLSPTMRAIGHALAESTRLRFRDGRDPSGAPWAPLSPVTVARRRKGSSAPLLDTGRLRNSITYALDGRNAVIVGTNVIYGRMQQYGAAKGAFGRTKFGAPIPWGRVPPRAYLGVSVTDRTEVLAILRRRVSALS